MRFPLRTLFECLQNKLNSVSQGVFRRARARKALLREVQNELFWGQPLEFRRLEPRRVLSANFALGGGNLDLLNFAAGTDLTVTYESVPNEYVFSLSAGTWTNDTTAVDTGLSTLRVAEAALTGDLNINSLVNTGVLFDGNFTTPLNIADDDIDNITIGTLGAITNNAGTVLNLTTLQVTNSGSIDLGGKVGDEFNFGTLNFNSVGNVFITEQSDMTLVGANTALDAKLTTTDPASDLNINGTLTATDDVLLMVGRNLTEGAAGGITADGLALDVNGTTTLDTAANNVNTFAANNDGSTLYIDSDTLSVGSVTVDTMTVIGITTSNDNVNLNVNAGNLSINSAISLGNADLILDVTGNVTQTAQITADGLGLIVDGTTTLTNVANNVATIAVNNGGETFYTDADTLDVGVVTAGGVNVTGITTSDDNVKLTVLVGDLAINQAVALGAGNLFLDVTGNVTQTAAITAGGLGLMVDGTTTLNNVANNVNTIAADNGGETQYTDANGLTVGTVAVTGMSVSGITTSNDNVKLTVLVGDLAVNQAVALGAGNLFLDVTGNVTQTAAITAGGLGLMVDGTTTLNNAANNVATIAIDNGGETQFTDVNGLAVGIVTVAGMTVTGITTTNDNVKLTVNASDLAINQAVALGAGNLFLDVTGNVTQTAAITANGLGLMVDGTTTLNNVANNVNTIAADNGGETQYTDANGLAVGTVAVTGMSVSGITTSNDNVKLTVLLGDLAVNQTAALGAGNLFLDVTGNVTQTAAITAGGLGLMVDGTTTLNNIANNVNTIAADNGGETQYTDANGLAVGTVAVTGMSVSGITTSSDNVKLTVLLGDLAVNQAVTLGAGNLFLDVTGNVTQTAAITANGLGLMVDGTTTLNNVANNVNTIAADNGGETQYTDANGLTVGTVTVAGMTVTGITTSDDNVKLTVLVGDLAINQAIALGVGNLFLDVTGNVTQTAVITAGGLGLMVDGTTTLNNVANNVNTIAADNGGETQYTDANGLTVGTVAVTGMSVSGITTSNDNVKLTVLVGDLAVNQAVALGAGNLFLDVTGNVTQTAAITAGGLGLMVDGTTTLNNAANNVATIAIDNGGETQFTDVNGLAVGIVTVAGMTVTGITTTNDNVKLTVNASDLAINQAVALGAGNLFLDVTGNVTQTAAITANGLGLMVDGTTTLNNVANNINTIAADNGGETQYTDANGLNVGTVAVTGMSVSGITTSNDNVKLTVLVGDLAINQAVALGAGNLFLDVTGNVTQTAAITAGGLGLMVDGTTTLNNIANNVNTIAADNGGETQYTDANGLAVGTVAVTGMSVSGITTSSDNVKLTVLLGDLAVNQAVTLGAGNLFLDVTGNVTQTAAITANGLGLMVDGTTTLNNVANNVNTIAADNGGETQYTDANGLTVGTVTVAGMTVTGITTSDDNVKLTVLVGDLAINQAIALGVGNLFLDVTGNVTQTAVITAGGLGLMVDGTTTLNNVANNVNTIAADNGGETQYTDANGLTVGTVAVTGMSVSGITTSNDNVKLTVLVGDLAVNQAVALGAGNLFLDVTGNVTQTAAITAGGLGLMVDGATTLTNAGNNVGTLAASNGLTIRYTNSGDLNIGTVTVAGMTVEDVVSLADIIITARSIIDADPVDAVPIDYDIDGVNVSLTATLGSIGSSTGDPLCDGVFNLLEVRATGNLNASAPNGVVALDASVGGTSTIAALSGVLQSNGDIDASTLDVSLTTNLYLIADADRNGVGNLIISSPLSVAGDLRLQGADIVSGGPLVLRADRILFVSDRAETINVADSLLNPNGTPLVLDARAGGTLTVNATGDVVLQDLDCDNVALSSSTLAGDVTLTSTGSVTVLDDVIAGFDGAATSSTGNIQIFAATNLFVNDAIVSDLGNIVLQANNDVRIALLPVPETDDLVVVTSSTGTIEVAADFNNDNNGAGGELFMSDSARIIAGRDSVAYVPGIDGNPSPTTVSLSGTAIAGTTVTLTADENITVGSVQSANNSAAAIQITSRNGGIVDGGDTDIDLVANFTGALTTLRAVTGIGNGNALETSLYAVDAVNAAGAVIAVSGDISLNEVTAGGDLRLVNANNSGSAIQIQVDAGQLDVLGLGATTSTGNILLRASQDVTVDATVRALNGGHITLDAGDDVNVNFTVQTDVSGDIYIEARNAINDAVGPAVDGINIDAVVSANNGAVLFRSSRDIRTTADIDGLRVGLTASRDVLQNSNIQASADDVAIVATTGNFTMSPAALITAAGNIVATAGASIALGSLAASDVGLAAGGSITRIAGSGVNVVANRLSMQAATGIGTAVAPIETTVATLAANTTSIGASIFVNESDSLIVGSVPSITASVTGVNRVNFQAGLTSESLTATTTPVSGISTANGDAKLTVGGNLAINQAIALGTGKLFLGVTGNVTQTAAITAAELGLMVTGTTTLQNAANNVNILAANNGGGTLYTDADALTVGTVTVGGMTATGITTSDDDVKLTAGGNLAINQAIALGTGKLFLSVTGNVTQTAAITAAELGLMVTGTTTLQNAANNVNIFAADNGGVTLYTDVDGLTVGTVTVDGMTVTGITTSNDDVKLTVGGDLAINQAIALGTGKLFLGVTGNVTQTAAITAAELGLMVTGTTTLQNAANNVNIFAADNGGVTLYTDVDGLTVGTVTVDGMTVTGITTSDDDVKLTVGGNLAINQAIALGTGKLFLGVTGNVTQTAAITAAELGLMVTGTTTLQNVANNVNIFAADNGGVTLYTDVDGLTVGTVTVDGMTVTGITTSDDDVKLTVGGNLAINQAIALGTGKLFLGVTGNVTQTAAITAAELGLMVTGTTTLQNAANNVNIFAADNGGVTLYTDVDGLTVGTVTVDGMTVTGITTSDDDVKLTVGGNLAINQAIALGTGKLFLSVTGNVTQTAAITAAELGLMVTGTTTLQNVANNVNIFAADNGGVTLYTDVDGLTVGTVTVDGMTVTGITTSDDDVKLTAGGNLAINQAIALGTGRLFLGVTGNVTQTAAITAAELGLMVTGTTTLQNVANNVNIFAADNGGVTLYTDVDGLTVGAVTVDGMTVTGITTSDDDVKLTVGGNLAINQAIALGTGKLFLGVTGNVTQTAAITAAELGLMVTGTTTLQNAANNVNIFAADNGGVTLYTDLDGLTVGTVTVDGMTVTGITTSDDDVKLTVGGNLAINQAIALGTGKLFLSVTGNVTQTAAITAAELGLMVTGTTTLQNAANNVNIFAADNGGVTLYTDVDGLTVGTVTVDGMTVTGITTSDDDVKLTVGGDLAINQAIALGTGKLFLDVTGNVTQTAAITAAELGLMVDGATMLTNVANNVAILAADNGGQTLYTDADTLTVGSVTVAAMTVTGITTTNDDVTLTVLANDLRIAQAINLGTGDLLLDVNGNVTQAGDAVNPGAGTITANGLALVVDGATLLTNPLNNVATLAANNQGQTIYTDADGLTVGTVDISALTLNGVTVTAVSVSGITTTNDDVTLTVLANNLQIAQAINLGTGDLLLDVTGNVTQAGDAVNPGAGTITANGLALVVDGATLLTNPLNNVATLAANNQGQTMYTDANGLTVGTVDISALTLNGVTVTAVSISGITTTNDDVTLTVLANNLQIDQAINLGTGDLLLDVTGNVTQAGDAVNPGAGTITANGLALVVDGATLLTNPLNNVATLAANNQGQTMVTDADGLTVGTVDISALTLNGVTVAAVSVSGIATTNDDVTLTVLANDLRIAQAINLGTGDLLLDVTGNVSQAGDAVNPGAGTITANGLALVVDGATLLTNPLNNVATLAANNQGQTMYTDADGLTVGTVDISALTINGVTVAAVSVSGITTTNDDVTLTVRANDLRIAQAINLGTGDLLLDVTGNVTQAGDAVNPGAGIITANGLALVVDGATLLTNPLNNVATLAANNQGQTMYTDANGLTVGTVDISALTINGVTVAAVSVSGITTTNDDVTLTVLANDLRIAQAINLGTGNLLLDVAGNVTQAGDAVNPGAGTITANGLALVVDGATLLTNPLNNVTTLAANNQGQTMYTDANGLTVGTVDISALSLSGVTVAAVSVSGITTTNDDVTLTVLANDLRIAQAINLGTGDLLLDVTGNVTQAGDAVNPGAGIITANGLALVVDGATLLTNPLNNVATLAANNQVQTMYTDANGLTVGTVDISALSLNGVTVAALSVSGITTTNDDVTLTVLANNLQIDQAINLGSGNLLLHVTGNVSQAGAGIITANGLALVVDGTTVLTNPLNNVVTLAANNQGQTTYTDADGLTVGTVGISALSLNGASVAAVSVAGITTSQDDIVLNVLLNDLIVNNAITTSSETVGKVDATADRNIDITSLVTAGTTNLTATKGHIDSITVNNKSVAVKGNELSLTAGTYAHLTTDVNLLKFAQVSSNEQVVPNSKAAQDYFNSTANAKGSEFLGTLDKDIKSALNFDPADNNTSAGHFQYMARYGGNYALYMRNHGNLTVSTIKAGTAGASDAPNVYIQTADETNGYNLTVEGTGTISTVSKSATAGGIVLVAGAELSQNGLLTTQREVAPGVTVVDVTGKFDSSNPITHTFYNAGQGPGKTSTEYVYGTYNASNTYANSGPDIDGLDPSNDYYQRVLLKFGNAEEKGFIVVVSYADGKTLSKYYTQEGLAGAAFDRDRNLTTRDNPYASLFDNDFLANNPTLPTNALIRRADSMFLFSDNGAKDLTFVAAPILNVKSQGTPGGGYVTVEPEIPTIQGFVAPPIIPVIPTLTQPQLPEIELPAQLAKNTEVAIYRVDFEGIDANENGQIEQVELPSYEIVLEKGLDDDSEKTRIPIVSKTGGKTPTQDDIDREKYLLQNNPNQPAGAYAIIKKDADGNTTVLDIFTVRDWPEKQSAPVQDAENVELPKLEPFNPDALKGSERSSGEVEVVPPPVATPKDSDSSQFSPTDERDNKQESRFASAGLLLGSLWMLRNSTSKNNQARLESTSANTTAVDYSSQARRRRQRAK